MTTTSLPTRCQARAWSQNGRISGMSDAHRCRFNAKHTVTVDGETFAICGNHKAALKTTYRPGRPGGRVSFGITVIRGNDYLGRGETVRISADTPTQPLVVA